MQTPWKVLAAFMGVFVAGSIFGGFFALRVDRERGPQRRTEPQQPVGPLTLRLMRNFAERLDLTAEQKEKLRPVMERAGEDIRRVQQSQFREMGVLVDRLQQDISQVLTPEQKVKLEAMKQQQRERMKGDRDRNGGPDRRGDGLPGIPGGRDDGIRNEMRERIQNQNRSRDGAAPPPAPTQP
jgi:Spy/CpxP family protein refolding chaperone